jgi:hypothetical protein
MESKPETKPSTSEEQKPKEAESHLPLKQVSGVKVKGRIKAGQVNPI